VKTGLLLLSILALPPADAQSHAELSQVQTVYLLRMKAGFDQHLANRITGASLFRVVTDPAKADVVITDRLGKSFEDQMKELYPPPPEAEPKEAKEPEAEESGALPSIQSSERPRSSSMGTTTGTIFLVDRRSNQVIWSTYAKPKSYAVKDLDHTAVEVVKRIQEALRPAKP